MTSTQVKQGWKKVKIGDICKEYRQVYEPSEEDVLNYIGMEHVEQQTLRISEIGKSSDTQSSKYKFNAGDILFGKLRPYFRKVVRPKFEGVCSTEFAVIRSNRGYEQGFVYYLLANSNFISAISNTAQGTRMPRATWHVISKFEIIVPEIDTQQKIASILSAFDDLIENNTKRIKILENTAQLIYKEWFVDFKFPGHEKVKMVDSGTEFGEIPEGWEVKEIKNFGEVITGKTPSKKVPENFGNDVPFIKTPDMHGEMFIIETNESLSLEGAETQKKKTLPKNSLIVSCIGSVGVVAITSKDSQTNQQINAVVPNDEMLREYLYIVFLGLKPTLEGLGSSGATMCNVNKQKFESIQILVPTNQILEEYHKIVAPMFDETLALQRQKKHLQETRDLLLPKLVGGEVEVDNLTIN